MYTSLTRLLGCDVDLSAAPICGGEEGNWFANCLAFEPVGVLAARAGLVTTVDSEIPVNKEPVLITYCYTSLPRYARHERPGTPGEGGHNHGHVLYR